MQEPIAVIGIGCRFPGADNPQKFWQLLSSGSDAIREVPGDRWNQDVLSEQSGQSLSYYGGFLDHIDQWDWRAFRLLPREAKAMDPQHRLLLEVAWEALDDAGIPLSAVAGSQAGVFIGIGWSDYLRLQTRNWGKIDSYTATGNATCFAANRLSYFFDLKGPSIALDAGCTSSLSAIHLACQSLWLQESDLALVGGVQLLLSPDGAIMAARAGLLASDGRCKTLDARADGFVNGEGAGILVLKRLSQVRPSDRVYALLCGSAVEHNGHNEWIMATSQAAQESLLRRAYHAAQVDPTEIDYVELHGTGFLKGDAIEAYALGHVLGEGREASHPCLIGSVKTNIGHLGAAAGIASVIKVALALAHREIPPSLNLQQVNPQIPLQQLHLDVPRKTVAWPKKESRALAGVSTLALSGANAHVVLAEPPSIKTSPVSEDEQLPRLLVLSAHTATALQMYADTWAQWLTNEAVDAEPWKHICYTASARRSHHQYRLAVVVRTGQEAAKILSAWARGEMLSTGLYHCEMSDPWEHWKQLLVSNDSLLKKLVGSEYSPDILLEGEQNLQRSEPLPLALGPELCADEEVLMALAILYTQQYTIDWKALYGEHCRCVSLPTFPWQRERLWPEWLDVATISTPPERRREPLEHVLQTNLPTEKEGTASHSLEETLASIWAEVLGLERVGIHESFFELGGHSLSAAQLITQVRSGLHQELTLAMLLQAPTPMACAAVLQQQQSESQNVVWPKVVMQPDQRYEPFPTTDVQQAYWIGRDIALEELAVGNHGYIEVEAREIDIPRFNLALQRLIARHDMLRAVMLPDGQQQILPTVPPFEVEVIDLRDKDAREQADVLLRLRQEMDHQLFPLEQWPAFAIKIVHLDSERSQLHLGVESLFVDAWSMHLLVQEFVQLYHDPALSLPELELSFRDYLLAEQEFQASALYEEAEKYWMQRLTSLPPAPELPLAQHRDSTVLLRFVHRQGQLEAELWERLKARAARRGLTPSGILLAAFAEVLGTWSKSARFSINLSIFNRLPLHPQVNSIVGDFTSLIVLAVDNTARKSFEQRARAIQEQLWQDLDHSYYSGVRVLRELARQQGSMASAVMPIVFTSLLIQDMAYWQTPPWQETIYAVSQTPQVWLDHQVLESEGRLVYHWQVVEGLFPDGLIEAMFEAYSQVLQQLATEEAIWQAVSLHVLPQEQQRQRVEVNATDFPYEDCLLHELFHRQAKQQPGQIAVITPQRTLDYVAVYSRATQIATLLRQQKVQPNQLVGIVMEKGWEQVVAALGILQAGAAYLPIDATLPTGRLHYLLAHGQVQVVLTQSYVAQSLDLPAHIHQIDVDTVEPTETTFVAMESVQKPEDLAYVIYTSGSTGVPKGVMIDHRGAVNTILDINERFEVTSADRVLALSAFNFDLSVYDIFGTLAAGGTIVMPPEGSLHDPAIWLDLLVKEHVTVWNSVPALAQMLVEYAEHSPDVLSQAPLRLALLSGDWIPLSLPEQMRKHLPALQVISIGGATEASIWSILYPIEEVDPSWKSIPYGKPMHNQYFAVLNERLEPCPVWVPGQLYIGGVGVAKGYWQDEEKTQASFITYPLTGACLYRTGDLGRYLPDGNIEFLGREDFQVKIGGHRIELGEIEANLLQHPEVQAAVVTAVPALSEHEKRLIAYVVLQSARESSDTSKKVSDAFSPKPLHVQQDRSTIATLTAGNGNPMNMDRHIDVRFGRGSVREKDNKQRIKLESDTQVAGTIEQYKRRLSYRNFLEEPIAFEDFCGFLSTLAQVELEGLPKYRYPSAGSIYPVQVYLYIKPKRIERIAEGIYYYNPQSHELVYLSPASELKIGLHGDVNQPIFTASAFSLFLIGQLEAVSTVYGKAARDFCLLEAGYMSQLLMDEAPNHHIGLCPIGAMDFEAIRDLFALDNSHILLHSLLGGLVDPTLATGWSFLQSRQRAEVSQPTAADSASRLRSYLQEKLPAYMVPSAVVVLDTLPLTPNGKVNRNALPIPALGTSDLKKSLMEPRTATEETLKRLWSEVINLKNFGIEDNFFELGGDSLAAAKLLSRIRTAFSIELPFRAIFANPTIMAMAEAVEQAQFQQQSELLAQIEHLSDEEVQTMLNTTFVLREGSDE